MDTLNEYRAALRRSTASPADVSAECKRLYSQYPGVPEFESLDTSAQMNWLGYAALRIEQRNSQ